MTATRVPGIDGRIAEWRGHWFGPLTTCTACGARTFAHRIEDDEPVCPRCALSTSETV